MTFGSWFNSIYHQQCYSSRFCPKAFDLSNQRPWTPVIGPGSVMEQVLTLTRTVYVQDICDTIAPVDIGKAGGLFL